MADNGCIVCNKDMSEFLNSLSFLDAQTLFDKKVKFKDGVLLLYPYLSGNDMFHPKCICPECLKKSGIKYGKELKEEQLSFDLDFYTKEDSTESIECDKKEELVDKNDLGLNLFHYEYSRDFTKEIWGIKIEHNGLINDIKIKDGARGLTKSILEYLCLHPNISEIVCQEMKQLTEMDNKSEYGLYYFKDIPNKECFKPIFGKFYLHKTDGANTIKRLKRVISFINDELTDQNLKKINCYMIFSKDMEFDKKDSTTETSK